MIGKPQAVFSAITSYYRWTRKRIRFNKHARNLYKQNKVTTHAPLSGNPHFFIVMVVMIRGEDDYLLEWIEFHLMMGVEHFFIYHNDNGLEKDTKVLLRPYIEKGVVTYIPWPDIPGLRDTWNDLETLSIQQLAYGHCTLSFRQYFKWLIKIDVDEFIYPKSPQHSRVAEVLRTLDDKKIMTININRTEFGSSGHKTRPEGLVVGNYTLTADHLSFARKAIANSAFLANDLYSNAFSYRHYFWSGLRGKLFGYPRCLMDKDANDLFVVNHYQIKSLEEYERKFKINIKGYYAGRETVKQFYKIDERVSKVENKDVMRLLPQLKRRLSSL